MALGVVLAVVECAVQRLFRSVWLTVDRCTVCCKMRVVCRSRNNGASATSIDKAHAVCEFLSLVGTKRWVMKAIIWAEISMKIAINWEVKLVTHNTWTCFHRTWRNNVLVWMCLWVLRAIWGRNRVQRGDIHRDQSQYPREDYLNGRSRLEPMHKRVQGANWIKSIKILNHISE